ncbi:peptidase family M20/M25/M40 protein [Paecilomyces variotii No. 5]|uniref:Peptidase family M20/M25/M40 protein n=1 Tax=Byssochlamys spectabilis (strain No. 5 / NBRC 109023) TaxID=1356009 RepID=V5FPX8_BYSSN|nr:peptidase family M20/M25/M40 protein [Paecilomyces variotii No. 5]
MASPPSSDSITTRRGRQLAPIQTNFSRRDASPAVQDQRNHRPRPEDYNQKASEKVPLQPKAAKRQSSMTSLRNIFSRRKSLRKNQADGKLAVIDEDQTAATQNKCPASLSPRNAAASTPTLAPTSPVPQEARTPSRLGKAMPPATVWVPPPLFQAYPQAVKHAVLMTPCLSADSILRISTSRRNSSVTEDTYRNLHQNNQLADGERRKEDKDRKHSRKVSGSISKTEWRKKIFILVTSGYILQYSAEGNFDRLPEKLMQLGPKSVAFASDAIPGRHWVLQISQSSDDSGTVVLDDHGPRTLFSRFGLHGSEARKSTRSFLMVHNSPEEMNSWIVTVRREIESLGGRKYVAESPADDPASQQLQSKPSFRYSVRRDPYRFPSPFLELSPSPDHSIRKKSSSPDMTAHKDTASVKSMNRRSMPPRPSMEAPSFSTVNTVTELDQLRGNPRLSYVSGEIQTYTSSACSSPPTSPIQPDSILPIFSQVNYSAAAQQSRAPAAIAPKEKRRSTHAYSPPRIEPISREPSKSSIRSAVPAQTGSTPSTTAPNFSVPFSRKPVRVAAASETVLPPLDTRKKMYSEPLSPDSWNGSPVTPARGPPEPATPLTRKNSQPRSMTPPKALFHGHDTPGSVSSTPHVSPKSAPNRRRGSSRVRELAALSTAFEPQLPASHSSSALARPVGTDIGADMERPVQLRQATLLAERNAAGFSLSTVQSQGGRGISTQIQNSTASLPQGTSPPVNGRPRRGSSSTPSQQQYQRNKVPISNSAMIGAAARPQTVGRLTPRKSLPDLSLGPPSAPPPNCPLPAVPPSACSKFQPAWRGDLVSQKAPMNSSQKSFGSNMSKVPPDHVSTGGRTQPEHRRPSLVKVY